MKRSSLNCALAAGLFLMPCGAASPGQGRDSAAALQADHALIQAFASADESALTELLDPEFTWIDANGKSLARGQVLESLPNLANANVQPQLFAYDNVAVLRASRERLHVLRIWVRREAGWRASLYQEVQQVQEAEPLPSAPTAQAPAKILANPFPSHRKLSRRKKPSLRGKA